MIIAVDMDETLVNLLGKWLYYHNNRYGTTYTREDVKDYSFGGLFNTNEFRDFLRIPGFHADLPWMDPEAPNVLRRLREDGHRIIIATHSAAWEAPRDKYQWIHTHLRIPGLIDSMRDDVFLGGEKRLIRADMLIDDGPHNFERFGGTRVIYDQPWNRTYGSVDYRVRNWTEVEAAVLQEEHERISYYRGGCY